MQIKILMNAKVGAWSEFVGIQESVIKKAAFRAINKTVRWLRPTVARSVAQDLKIKVGLVRNTLQTISAKRTDLNATVGLPKRAGVIKAIDLGNARQTNRGVTSGKRQWDGAFIATMPTGHKGIFKRKGKSRLPINEIHLVITGRLADAMEEIERGSGLRQFKILFDRELRFLTRAK